MNTIISVYGESCFKEIVLPNGSNIEYSVLLEADEFNIKEAYTLNLENIDGVWYIIDGYNIIIENKQYEGEQLTDGCMLALTTQNSEKLAIMVREVESSFFVYRKFSLMAKSVIAIGSNNDNDIVYSNVFGNRQVVSGKHAEIIWKENNFYIRDVSSNGTFVNGKRLVSEQVLKFGDSINIWGLRIIYLGAVFAINHLIVTRINDKALGIYCMPELEKRDSNSFGQYQTDKEKIYFHRSPRNIGTIYSDAIEIEAPPSGKEEEETPLFMLIGPSFTMMIPMLLSSLLTVFAGNSGGGTFRLTGIITAVASGTLGIFWAVTNLVMSKKKQRQEESKRYEAYSAYLVRCADDIKSKYISNTNVLNEMYPNAETFLGSDGEIPTELWNRNRTHNDFMYYRLGLGNIPFQVEIKVPKDKFTMTLDNLADKPKFIHDSYKILQNVPVGIDLVRKNLFGIVGGTDKKGAYAVVRNLVSQIIAVNCYTDVKLAVLSDKETTGAEEKWEYMLWLPHVWSSNKKNRYTGFGKSECSDVCYELTQILRRRAEEKSGQNFPHIVLIIEDIKMIEDEPISKYIFDKSADFGLTTIIMAEKYSDLPNECENIIQNDDEYKGIYDIQQGRNDGTKVAFDEISNEQLLRMAKKLADIEVKGEKENGEIPNSITFLDMYGVDKVQKLNAKERWKKNRIYENMRSMIGIKDGGQPCYLDLHEKYHGPHGLVAGTTGSGKSETLQTYMLSLALNFSPDDIGYFIIDYKGGGMGNLFNNLPHVLGKISNLSGGQVGRAMVSIKSENMRRQRVFSENGVNNINAYTRLYKNGEAALPIPHLFIIIDEFAEMKREEPDFMRELISVAQVGRSLGVHLILATQKPSGTVDDNIWSNSKFRLCLRVQDKQDSNDMLHRPDAAYLTQTGRGFLQVGNDEIFEQFQSGWSGANYDEENSASKHVIAEMITNTGKTAIVGNHLKSKNKANALKKWIYSFCVLISGITGEIETEFDSETDQEEYVLNELYNEMEAAGIEYQRSEYNTKLLKNVLTLYIDAVNSDENLTDLNDIAEYIVCEAEERKLKLPEAKEKTQLAAVVEYLAETAVKGGYQKQQPLWLPVLPDKLLLTELDGYDNTEFDGENWTNQPAQWELKALIGKNDDPANQSQLPVDINFTADGNIAVCGISMSGKSTFIQTVVYSLISKYSPDYLNVYILDFSSRMLEPFEKAPHVGGILYESDVETVGKLFNMIKKIIAHRKTLFKGGNYSQFVAKNGMVCPAIVLIIDNIANFREKTEGHYDDELIKISRECTANGIYLLVSGTAFGGSEIPNKLRDNIKRTFCLEMNNKYEYSDAIGITQLQTLPESGIAGRGIAAFDGVPLVFQTCIAVDSVDDYDRIEKISKRCGIFEQKWSGRCAEAIPFIPEKPTWASFSELAETRRQIEGTEYLPFAYDTATADIVGISLRRVYCYLVSANDGKARVNTLKIMMRAAVQKQAKVCAIDFKGDELKKEAEDQGIQCIGSTEEYLDFINSMIPVFQKRAAIKRDMVGQSMDDEEIAEKLSYEEPYFIFINSITEYSNAMHKGEGKDLNFFGAMTNLLSKGSLLNIYFIAGYDPEARSLAAGESVFDAFVKYKTGLHLGGHADRISNLDFSGVSFRALSQDDKNNCGYITKEYDGNNLHILVPSSRG